MNETNPCVSCRYDFLRKREKELNLSAKNAEFLIPSYARFMKLAAGRLEWKADDYEIKKGKKANFGFELSERDIKSLFILCGQLDRYLEEITVIPKNNTGLSVGFSFKDQYDALDYFEKNLKDQTIIDSAGIKVHISGNRDIYMYKDDNGRHIFGDEFYVLQRGQRLGYVKHVLTQSKCLFERPYRANPSKEVDRMYLMAFREKWASGDSVIYFAVITRRSTRKGAVAEFKTAFPISNVNDLGKRVSGYRYIKVPEK